MYYLNKNKLRYLLMKKKYLKKKHCGWFVNNNYTVRDNETVTTRKRSYLYLIQSNIYLD